MSNAEILDLVSQSKSYLSSRDVQTLSVYSNSDMIEIARGTETGKSMVEQASASQRTAMRNLWSAMQDNVLTDEKIEEVCPGNPCDDSDCFVTDDEGNVIQGTCCLGKTICENVAQYCGSGSYCVVDDDYSQEGHEEKTGVNCPSDDPVCCGHEVIDDDDDEESID